MHTTRESYQSMSINFRTFGQNGHKMRQHFTKIIHSKNSKTQKGWRQIVNYNKKPRHRAPYKTFLLWEKRCFERLKQQKLYECKREVIKNWIYLEKKKEYAVKDYISNYTNVSNELTFSVLVGMNGTKGTKKYTHINVCLV